MITPRVLRGFRDSLPWEEERRLELIQQLQSCFRSYGFHAIDTPALEYSELLLGGAGGETEKQIYRFQDQGGRDVALRFDLTLPFARFVSLHQSKLLFPFKRYHVAKVWRGENSQRGRYREFYQCDFDIVGSTNISSDLEILLLANDCCEQLSLPCRIMFSHRQIIEQIFKLCEISAEESVACMRLLDKRAKIKAEYFLEQLIALLGARRAQELKQLFDEIKELEQLRPLLKDHSTLNQLLELKEQALKLGVVLNFDLSIMRGLDYYTGMVFESFLEPLVQLGSICSGGRYDNLNRRYSNSPLAGVGGSIGLDRVLAGLQELNLQTEKNVAATLFLPLVEEAHIYHLLALAKKLRPYVGCEIYHHHEQKKRNLGQQLQYASQRGNLLALIYQDRALKIRRLSDRYESEFLDWPEDEKTLQKLLQTINELEIERL